VRHETIDYIGASLILIIIAAGLGSTSLKLAEAYHSEPSDPQRYTVHFDGIDYQDLTRDHHGLSRIRAEYKTKAGKRIEFHGSFYEVEQ
jgi:hypothetical protein